MSKENSFPIVSSFNNSSDYVRMVVGNLSVLCTPASLATGIQSELLGLVNTAVVRETSSSGNLLSTDNTLLVDTSGGGVSINLPNPSVVWDTTNSKSNTFRIVQKIDGGNTLTVNPYNAEDIYESGSAQSSVALTGGSSITVETNGTDWIVVGS